MRKRYYISHRCYNGHLALIYLHFTEGLVYSGTFCLSGTG